MEVEIESMARTVILVSAAVSSATVAVGLIVILATFVYAAIMEGR